MIAAYIRDSVESPKAGVIRKMFEEGALLKKKYGAENVYDFSLGNPDLDPPYSVAEAIERIASDKSHGAHGYMPNAGYLFAREAMAKKTEAEQGVLVSAQHVVMSCGAAGALNVVLKSLLNAGDEVIVPSPYFTEYDHYIRNHAGTIVRVKTKSILFFSYV